MNTALTSSAPATTISNANASSSLIFDITKERSTPASHSIRDVYGTINISPSRYLHPRPQTSSLSHPHSNSSLSIPPTEALLPQNVTLDISQFTAKSDISIPEWHEAWAHYLHFLQEHASPEIHTCWANHYNILHKYPDFTDNWMAILTFNIEQRASYAADPQTLDEVKYFHQFEDIKGRVARKESLKAISDAMTDLKSHRHEPYPSQDSSFRKSQTSDKSFQAPNKPNDSECLPPLCLACAQLGHTFPNCPDLSSHSKVINKQLVSQSNADVKYCVDFNIFCNGKASVPNVHIEEAKFTPVPSADPLTMAPAVGNAWGPEPSSIPFSCWVTDPIPNMSPPHHVYLDNLSITQTSYDDDTDFTKIITPYSADNLDTFLRNANLLDDYSELVFKIKHGFPLSPLEPIHATYAPPNLPSANEHEQVLSVPHLSKSPPRTELQANLPNFVSVAISSTEAL
ncbi:hypothetical protein DFJ58DRAFT_838898 [Suillus subalutaceus]|uniref:uncharacterized protein n=1 Tax=Suillus subalutaceus TaxID=48586 RepID=UPI001B875222|nr:uncharacterized protein DFJ58DRAFT_838898 [Suillus subalutaceus]KAG1864781.1 hypothetical protein DFJ58DRAFT_838898 [Suillus subalutaceus]